MMEHAVRFFVSFERERGGEREREKEKEAESKSKMTRSLSCWLVYGEALTSES